MSKVIITGSQGRTGSVVYEGLQNEYGYDVVGVDIKAGHFTCDVADQPAFQEFVESEASDASAILHFALDTSKEFDLSPEVDPKTEQMWNSVLETAAATGIGRVVLCASTHVDARYKDAQPPLLTPVVGQGHTRAVYGENRLRMEQAALQAVQTHPELSVIVPRLGGYRQGDVVSTANPTTHRSWVSRRDMLHGFDRSISARYSGAMAFYLVSNNEDSPFDLSAGYQIGYVPKDGAQRPADSQN